MSEHRNRGMNKRQLIQKLKVGGGGGVMAQKQQGSIDQRDKVSFGCSLSPRFMMSKRHSFSYDSDEEVSSGSSPRINVPEGYLAVYVGRERRRFVIPTTYLRLPVFRALLEMAEEEFGFDHKGGLTLPCEVTFFKQILKFLKRNDPAQKQMSLNDILICIANERERETDALLWSKSMVPHSGASLQKSFG